MDVVVRRSNFYVSFTRWEACVRMFPTLFPGGCGGPNEKRIRPMSMEKWIERLFRIDGLRFEQHYAFLLLAFDFCGASKRKEGYVFEVTCVIRRIEGWKHLSRDDNGVN